jgi:hypothetical protein
VRAAFRGPEVGENAAGRMAGTSSRTSPAPHMALAGPGSQVTRPVELPRPRGVFREEAVEDDDVKVEVRVARGAESVRGGDRADAAVYGSAVGVLQE